MDKSVNQQAIEQLAEHLVGKFRMTREEVSEGCWQDFMDRARMLITQVEEAGLRVIPGEGHHQPRIAPYQISTMSDVVVIEPSQEIYLDGGDSLRLIREILTAMDLISRSPHSFIRVVQSA